MVDDREIPATRGTSTVSVLSAVFGVLAIAVLTFLAGPAGFFVAVGLFVATVAVASALQRRHGRRDR
jgi:hypothetical protein